MSFGADKSMVERMILKQGLKLTLPAVGIGAAAALGLTCLLRGLLFEVQRQDPVTSSSSARRWWRWPHVTFPHLGQPKVDPMLALRYE